ncbi:HindVP family restriction endonuclease [Prochlorothrix hollandica]|uniref:Restriction endonuclease HindVP n=1 Tax=Prochlorothrix hollandica PCC 9006 = CALU 1027 TaxID=317619 RepID=A0A0M2Q267_PROHO|nr:HindVP family restriction endonuclease [Prochlorothrix hollandica]KKJ01353.1 restriction endonuclease HindVP [Prochlorothrix hollandica PCC 9006 = CALU 1027]
MTAPQPSLFGLRKTNRDFTNPETWGKNQFNTSFPASLCCYLNAKSIDANYLSVQNGKLGFTSLPISDLFGIDVESDDLYFAFEAQHTPYQKYVVGSLPRTDLVIQRESTGECLRGLEIKLTALPDHTTCNCLDQDYGSELVVRPDTIIYLACSIATSQINNLRINIPNLSISDWSDPREVLPHIKTIIESIYCLSDFLSKQQTPFLIQPIWKTKGKSPSLADQCLDVFVWSDAGFSYFISQIANISPRANHITRQTRTAIWLFKMLLDISLNGKFNHQKIIDHLSYNTKNDKAFASAGTITNPYMACSRLTNPIIAKSEIQNIILGGGQNLLSPERRFDAIIYNSPELFQ